MEWHNWVKKYLDAHQVTLLSSVHDTILGGDAIGSQKTVHRVLTRVPPITLRAASRSPGDVLYAYLRSIGKKYDVRMEQDSHGRSDIAAQPLSAQRSLALIFEIKSVGRHLKRNWKRSPKTAEQMKKGLENAKIEALEQLADRRYRERVPRHATKVHEFAFVFCGKFCAATVRTLQRSSAEDWEEVAANSTVVSESMTDLGDEDIGDGNEVSEA